MNILREEFCKEKNVHMGLDDIYEYCTWLEKKLTDANQALQLHKTQVSGSVFEDKAHYEALLECGNKILDKLDKKETPQMAIMGLRILLNR